MAELVVEPLCLDAEFIAVWVFLATIFAIFFSAKRVASMARIFDVE